MYERLLNLWITNQLTEAQLTTAVQKKWITEEQKTAIMETPKIV